MKTHEQDEKFMELALEQARQALRLDEVPVGAVIVRNGQVIASGYNLREANQDPSAHAEMIAIRAAAHRLGSWRLEETRLYALSGLLPTGWGAGGWKKPDFMLPWSPVPCVPGQ